MRRLEGVLEKRGWARRWGQVFCQLAEGDQFCWFDVKGGAAHGQLKEKLKVEHAAALSSTVKGEEHAFVLHFKRAGGAKDKWVLRAKTAEGRQEWVEAVGQNLKEMGTEGVYNYGLPPNDPRTDLPLISVPEEFQDNFGYLNMAVIHWFGAVKKLGVGFAVEERIAVLGDRCLYLCKKNADITRCVMVSDISKLLLAQDDAKDLYISVIMPAEVPTRDESSPQSTRPEYDLMFHSGDIQTFVRYLRTVYVYQTQGKMLPLEQVKDKQQLTTEVRLGRPKGWEMVYWQPMFKEHLAKLLDLWYERQRGEKTEEGKGDGEQAKAIAAPPAAAAPAPAGAPAAAAAAVTVDDSDPLGKFLVVLGLSKYYACMTEKKMTLELMTCGLIDDSDLFHFGIETEADRRTIIMALQDKDLIDRLQAGDPVKSYKPPQLPDSVSPAKNSGAQALASDFAGNKPQLAADDDDDLDIDLDGPSAGSPTLGGGGDIDLDLDDFGALEPAQGGGGITIDDLDDLDLDLGGPSGGGGGVDLDDDLDLGGPAPAAAGAIDLDDDL